MTNSMGPDFITMQVRDLEASRRFYSEVIGLQTAPEVRPNAVAFATQPIGFAIRKAQGELDAIARSGYGIILWFHTNEATGLLKHLKERSVAIVQDLADGPFGKMLPFRDPDDCLIRMHDGG